MKSTKYKLFLILSALLLVIGFWNIRLLQKPQTLINDTITVEKPSQLISGKFDESRFKSEEEWKKVLTAQQYQILREAGTEIPFTGSLNNEKRIGTYYSVGCDKPLFRSEQKYDSGTGWPSFWAPIDENALVLKRETSIGDNRIEVLDTCGGHLGHVFDDGPQPTGKRFCMNSAALYFVPDTN